MTVSAEAVRKGGAFLPVAGWTLSSESQRELLEYARVLFDGSPGPNAEGELSPEIRRHSAPVILAVFHQDGRLLCETRVEPAGRGLDQLVAEAVALAREELPGAGSGAPVFLHLMLVGPTARFPNFGIAVLFDGKIYEPRVTGLAYELGGTRHELSPLRALALDLDSKRSRAYLAAECGFSPTQMASRADLEIEIYHVTHFGEALTDRRYTRFFRGHRVLDADEISPQTIRESLRLIGCWYEHNVIDSEVTYLYRPASRKYDNDKRTIVRSTMAAWILNRLAFHLADERLKELGEETIRFYLERYFQMGEASRSGRLEPSTEPLANGYLVANHYTAAAFIVAAILERRELSRYRVEVDLLIDWCLGFQRDDGTLWTEWGQNQLFMPGQLMLVLAYLYRETNESRYRAHFESVFAAYERPYESLMDLGPETCTPYAPAWVTQPAAEMFRLTGHPRYASLVFRIDDRVAEWCAANARYQVHPDYDGILAPKTGHYGNNSITAAALESLVEGADLARRTGDDSRFETYLGVIRRTTAYLMRLQYTNENSYYVQERERVLGGFKKDLVHNTVWCDSIWHAASAFMKIARWRLLESEAP